MTVDQEAVRHVALSSSTRYPRDLAIQAMLIRSARSPEERRSIVRMILDARAEWLDWLTRTQRDWQTKVSRRPLRQRHHDSGAIREQSVRCAIAR